MKTIIQFQVLELILITPLMYIYTNIFLPFISRGTFEIL